MKKNQPKNHHLTIRINDSQFNSLRTYLKKVHDENLSTVIRESLQRFLNVENNKPKI